ncbi:MAG: hypothetical protein V4459_11075 [Pseudomonadota bacterium]
MADEKTTVVNTGGGGGVGVALIAVAVIAALVVLFLVFGQRLMNNTDTPIKADVKIDTPSKP